MRAGDVLGGLALVDFEGAGVLGRGGFIAGCEEGPLKAGEGIESDGSCLLVIENCNFGSPLSLMKARRILLRNNRFTEDPEIGAGLEFKASGNLLQGGPFVPGRGKRALSALTLTWNLGIGWTAMGEVNPYFFLAVFCGVAFVFPLMPLALAWAWRRFLQPPKPGPDKNSTYECGIEVTGGTRIRFKPQYYLYCIIFLVFDVEAIFLIPFAVSFTGLPVGAFVAILVFVFLLLEGLVWAWSKGCLKWADSPGRADSNRVKRDAENRQHGRHPEH